MRRSARYHRVRPWLFAAATLAAAAALILRVTADTGPDIHPSVVLSDELPRPMPPAFVPSQGTAAISPETEPPTAAPQETKPTRASASGLGATQGRPAGTQPADAAPAPVVVDNVSPDAAPSAPPPDAPPASPAAFTPEPAPTPAPREPQLEKRWF